MNIQKQIKKITLQSKVALILFGVGLAILPIVLTSCNKNKKDNANNLKGTIEIAGSSTVFPITSAIAEEFVKLHPDVNIPVRSTGTGGGFSNFFVTGTTDINNASRTIKQSEIDAALANGIEAIGFQVATDAITIVVNLKNPVNNITTDELKKIWHPDIAAKKWSDVNTTWPAIEFELFGPSSASGTFDYFTDEINGKEGLSRADYQKTEQDNTIIQAVEGSVAALGYLGLAYYEENKDNVKALSVNGVSPNIETARSNKYTPLSRPIFIYVSSKALIRPEIQAFVKFYLEQTATSLISEVGYVPLAASVQTENLAKLEQAITTYKNTP